MSALDNNSKWLQQMRDGKTKIGVNLNMINYTATEMLARAGYDWVMIDTQHSPINRGSFTGWLFFIPIYLLFIS